MSHQARDRQKREGVLATRRNLAVDLELRPLVGATILAITVKTHPADGQPCPHILLAVPGVQVTYVVQVWKDPEGNGAGHLNIVRDNMEPMTSTEHDRGEDAPGA